MKIFFIDPMSYNNLAIYDYNLLENIKAKENIYFYGNIKYNFLPFTRKNVQPLLYFNYGSKKHLHKIISYTISLIRIFIDIRNKKPDIIHFQWLKFWYIDYPLLRLVKLIYPKIKFILTAHNVLPHQKKKMHFFQFKCYYHFFDLIIIHSESSHIELQETFKIKKNKIAVIPHGLLNYIEQENDIKNTQQILQEKYSLFDKTIFSHLGTQSYYKGTDLLLNSWIESKELANNPNIILLLAGSNKQLNYSKIEIPKNVVIINEYLTDTEFIALLRLSSVVVLPYRTISQSGVLLTCLNEEIPILVSDAGGLNDPLKIANVGWCMGDPSTENIKKYLEMLIASEKPINIKNLSEEWQKIKKYYSWGSIGIATLQLYSKILKTSD